ncbi:MAG: FAD-binding domain-containing protein [Alphaproteobacteria bacterium]
MIQVVWFKRDLRTEDHRPLAEAAIAGPVLPLYVVEPQYWSLPDTSKRQWMVQGSAVQELSRRLTHLGAPLIIRVGQVVDVLEKIHASVGISRLLAHEETGNLWTFRRDNAVRAYCRSQGITFVEYSQTGIIRGLRARDRWAAHHSRFMAEPLVPEPSQLLGVTGAKILALPSIERLGLADDGCDQPQLGTRESALGLIESFLSGRGANYRRGMSSPLSGAESCSRLSVPLTTGAVSVREVLQRLYAARRLLVEMPSDQRTIPVTALDSLIARLHWRGHFMQKLESEPELEVRSFHPVHQLARAATIPNDETLELWASGNTGIPFVDACMRSLIATGWLNFRMRAMVQSFASYHLGLDWRASGERLARLFSDYEPGIHWPQVQMQSGQTGINTPRIYNPFKQGQDQDPNGRFTREWVPELATTPLAFLQKPWLWREGDLGGYREAIIDPQMAARVARARLTALRQEQGYKAAAQEVYRKHGSRKRPIKNNNPSKGAPKASTAQLSLRFDE